MDSTDFLKMHLFKRLQDSSQVQPIGHPYRQTSLLLHTQTLANPAYSWCTGRSVALIHGRMRKVPPKPVRQSGPLTDLSSKRHMDHARSGAPFSGDVERVSIRTFRGKRERHERALRPLLRQPHAGSSVAPRFSKTRYRCSAPRERMCSEAGARRL